ncbi:rhodanese-like domain-containing protein [Cellulomonas iranensis]|uniref:Rhodanese-related sulfurtransferase/acyl carrier protein n=1 Tax=Cellulomonas iranensis TaxID=76862 RepID=A0ABU0GJW8_9CELL|nr:rhodanese-like domain-containing protein [Cellulomonas iranensis]MDQ0425378.1 rhodanese-related sulfurtransferase/acyl carrier protein [Cellulomonas iranensis]
MTTALHDTVRDKVAGYLEAALGRPVDVAAVPESTALSELGLDSLLTISVIVSLLDDAGVDMFEHSDSLVTPSTLADLHALAARFHQGDDTVTTSTATTTDELRDQQAHYSAKLAYEMDSFDLAQALEDGQDVVVVDGRSAAAYEAEHIRGAVSIPHRSMSADSLADLSREPLYVAYCDGIGCNASTKAALKLSTAGFRVRELIGGLDWWKRDGHPTEGSSVACRVDASHSSSCGCEG